jgi:hypothetical protein
MQNVKPGIAKPFKITVDFNVIAGDKKKTLNFSISNRFFYSRKYFSMQYCIVK